MLILAALRSYFVVLRIAFDWRVQAILNTSGYRIYMVSANPTGTVMRPRCDTNFYFWTKQLIILLPCGIMWDILRKSDFA